VQQQRVSFSIDSHSRVTVYSVKMYRLLNIIHKYVDAAQTNHFSKRNFNTLTSAIKTKIKSHFCLLV